VKSRIYLGNLRLGLSAREKELTARIFSPEGEDIWKIINVPFTVPSTMDSITIFAEFSQKGTGGYACLDDFQIIANKVAKRFPA